MNSLTNLDRAIVQLRVAVVDAQNNSDQFAGCRFQGRIALQALNDAVELFGRVL